MEVVLTILIIIAIFFGPSIYESLKDKWNENNKPKDSNYNRNTIDIKSNEVTNENIAPKGQENIKENSDIRNELLIKLNSSLLIKGLKELNGYKNKSSKELLDLIKTKQVNDKITKIYIDDDNCPIYDKFYIEIEEGDSKLTMNGLDNKPSEVEGGDPTTVITSYIDVINKQLEKQTLSDIEPFTEFENPTHTTFYSGFSEGVAFIEKNEKIWAINTSGEIIHGPYKTCPNGYNDDWCIVKGEDENNYAIDKEGKKVFGDYPRLSNFSNGFSTFKHGMKPAGFFQYDTILKFIDKNKNILPFEFTSGDMFGIPPTFKDGIAFVKYQDGIYGFNTKGEKILGPYMSVVEFNEGIACVTKDKKEDSDENEWFVINNKGEILSGPYNEALRFHNGLAIFTDKKTQLPCYINSKGETVIGPMNASLNEFSDGYAIIEYRDFDADSEDFGKAIKKYLELGLKNKSSLENFVLNEVGDLNKNSKGTYIINTKGDIVFGPYNKPVENLGYGHFCISTGFRTKSLIKGDGSISEKEYNFIGHYNSGFFPVKLVGQENWSLIDENENVLEIKHVEDSFSEQKIKGKTTEETYTKTVNKIETQEYHVIGVQFDSYQSGCYYYFGDNNVYNIGDRVLVPTSNNGNQEATVVFRKIYRNKSEIPYGGNLKSVIRKL